MNEPLKPPGAGEQTARCPECDDELSDDEQRRGVIWCDNCKYFDDNPRNP